MLPRDSGVSADVLRKAARMRSVDTSLQLVVREIGISHERYTAF